MRYDVRSDQRIRARGAELVSLPVTVTVGKIDEKRARKFALDMERAHRTGQPIIPIVIESFGGDAYSLLSMVAQLKASRLPVATIVEGKAMSAGALLFSYGQYRFMAERATLMVHDISSSARGKLHEMAADSAEAERLQRSLLSEMARNCGKPDGYFLHILDERKHAEWYLTAKDAMTHGFIDRIGIPRFAVDVTVRDSLVGPDGRELLTGAPERRTVRATTRKRRAR